MSDFTDVFPRGERNDAYARYFTGQSYLARLVDAEVTVSNVTFEPGCRNQWHTHHTSCPVGQVLLCTAGRGWYQADGEAPRSLGPGDVVVIPSGVRHWHGAAAGSWFSHLALSLPGEGDRTEWGEPVSDAEYAALPEHAPARVTAGRDRLGSLAPFFAGLNDDVLFGQVWAREGELARRDRSLATVSALLGAGVTGDPLLAHLRMGLANGLSADELAEVVTHVAFYVGWPRAWEAFGQLQRVLDEREE